MQMVASWPLSPPSSLPTNNQETAQKPLVFDASILNHQPNIPPHFIWPDDEKPCREPPPILLLPPIDLKAFHSGDPLTISNYTKLVNEACQKHGMFLVVNHGIDSQLINEAHKNLDYFFQTPLAEKQKVQRKLGDHSGYSSSFTNRFSSKLPWKETLSFRVCVDDQYTNMVEEYFLNAMGEDFRHFGYESNDLSEC
ncbi:unnamed protein product [Ilex paraguariensis]|uniref:Non-haem dioxygenase N-terminal domain-containing protein n=1 Tax=Ilex paraguariensis TaxID=185542 RepID=A0ABC8RLE9_9AQUA